ncbi:hypothetical protein P9139_00100 [Curtobacterium flaccumfaciens]|nr:hypothetical protein P9139_00100 [Curtobacterium flaccumfaciens]
MGEHLDAVRRVYARAEQADWPDLQRIHGDLHLGQVLAAPKPRGWVFLDFEGEPLRPLAERSLPDVTLRDVAGMLRSFDYVAGALAQDLDPVDAGGWAHTARSAFLDGYQRGTGTDLREHRELLDAFELDKAVYEVVYETRDRPAGPVSRSRRSPGWSRAARPESRFRSRAATGSVPGPGPVPYRAEGRPRAGPKTGSARTGGTAPARPAPPVRPCPRPGRSCPSHAHWKAESRVEGRNFRPCTRDSTAYVRFDRLRAIRPPTRDSTAYARFDRLRANRPPTRESATYARIGDLRAERRPALVS